MSTNKFHIVRLVSKLSEHKPVLFEIPISFQSNLNIWHEYYEKCIKGQGIILLPTLYRY
jgi:hypothetical protein